MNRRKRHPTHTELNQLLDTVELANPVDSNRLRELILKNHINLKHFIEFYGSGLATTAIGQTPVDLSGWKEWRRREVEYATDRTSKITASATGDSHSVRNMYSMIPCWIKGSDFPQLAYWNEKKWYSPSSTSRELLILENETLFLMRQATIEGLRQWFETDYANMDWVFAGGNGITKAPNREFLTRYQRIHVMTDFDLGGLLIFNNLEKLMSGCKTELAHVFPNCMENLLNRHGKPFDAHYRAKTRKLLPQLTGNTQAAAKLILATGLRAEQEILLGPPND